MSGSKGAPGKFTERLRQWYDKLLKWVEGIFVLAILLCYALLVTGVITDWEVLIGLSVGMGIGLVALLLNTRLAVDDLGERVDRLVENQAWELLPLWQCQDDLEAQLKNFKPKQRVVIHHLGLDMAQAWDKVSSLLERCTHLKKVELKFLLLTADVKRLGASVPSDVKQLCAHVPLSLQGMKESFRELERQCGEQGAEVQVEVRQYSEIPTIHGFAIVQPEQVRYFSFCRWEGREGQKLGWGLNRYRKLTGEPIDSSLEDIVEIFDGAFKHLWHASSDQVAFKATFRS